MKPSPAQKAWIDGSITNHKPVERTQSWWLNVPRETWRTVVQENQRGVEAGKFGTRTTHDKPWD